MGIFEWISCCLINCHLPWFILKSWGVREWTGPNHLRFQCLVLFILFFLFLTVRLAFFENYFNWWLKKLVQCLLSCHRNRTRTINRSNLKNSHLIRCWRWDLALSCIFIIPLSTFLCRAKLTFFTFSVFHFFLSPFLVFSFLLFSRLVAFSWLTLSTLQDWFLLSIFLQSQKFSFWFGVFSDFFIFLYRQSLFF